MQPETVEHFSVEHWGLSVHEIAPCNSKLLWQHCILNRTGEHTQAKLLLSGPLKTFWCLKLVRTKETKIGWCENKWCQEYSRILHLTV